MRAKSTPTHLSAHRDKEPIVRLIGPNGKDVFAVAIVHINKGDMTVNAAMVEALSHDEARGIAHRMAKSCEGRVVINVQAQFGAFDVVARKFLKESSK